METIYKQVFEKYTTVFYKDSNVIGSTDSRSNRNGFSYQSSTDNEEDYIKNFANPLTSVSVRRTTVVVEKNDEKISLKYYVFMKDRSVGTHYFKKKQIVSFITYKVKTQDFYFGGINNGVSKRQSSSHVRKNYFGKKYLALFKKTLKDYLNIYSDGQKLKLGYVITESMYTFLNQLLGKEVNILKVIEDNLEDETLYRKHLENKNIKYPNNYSIFINKTPFPNKKILQKHDYKLIESFMEVKKLKGKKIKKVLHTCESINEFFYKEIETMFGEKFIKQQSDDVLKKIFESKFYFRSDYSQDLFSEEEKKRVFKVMIEFLKDGILNTFFDHIDFYKFLKQYEEIKWKSETIEEFRKEHIDWSNRKSIYVKGIYTRIFSDDFVELIQTPIVVDETTFYPTLFQVPEQYFDESSIQHNCVKTYVDRPLSIIISLRKDSIEDEDRATIEYRIGDNKNSSLRRVQSLGRFNSRLTNEWMEPLNIMDDRINSNIDKFKLPQIKLEKANRTVISDFTIENGNPHWTNPDMGELIKTNYIMSFYDELIF
jgi:hypothetical protein